MKKIVHLLLVIILVASQPFSVGAASFDESFSKYKNEVNNPLASESVELKVTQLIASAINENKQEDAELIAFLKQVGEDKDKYTSVLKQEEIPTLLYLAGTSEDMEPVDYTALLTRTDSPSFEVTLLPLGENAVNNFLISELNKVQIAAYNVLNNEEVENIDLSNDYTTLDHMRRVVLVMMDIREDYRKSIPQFNETVTELAKIVRAGKQENSYVTRLENLKKGGATSKLGVVGTDTALASTLSTFDGKGDLDTFFVDKGSDYYYVNEILQGQALSALYKPLHTNIYDKEYSHVPNDDKFIQFDNKYGNLRKALFIDDNRKAATAWMTNPRVKHLRVATLKDILNSEDEILLFSDTGYYNIETLYDSFINSGETSGSLRQFELKNEPVATDVSPVKPEVDVGTPAIDPAIEIPETSADPADPADPAVPEGGDSSPSNQSTPTPQPTTAPQTNTIDADAFTLLDTELPLYVRAVDVAFPPVTVQASELEGKDLKNLKSLFKWLNAQRTDNPSTNITDDQIQDAFTQYIQGGGGLYVRDLDFGTGILGAVTQADVLFAVQCVKAVDALGTSDYKEGNDGSFAANLFLLKATVFKSYINTYSSLPKIPKIWKNKAYDFPISDDMANVLVVALAASEENSLCDTKGGSKVGGYYSYINSALAEDSALQRMENYAKFEKAILGGSSYLDDSKRYQEYRNLLVKRVANASALTGKAVITPASLVYMCLVPDEKSESFVTFVSNDYDSADPVSNSDSGVFEMCTNINELLSKPITSLTGQLRWKLAGVQAYLDYQKYASQFSAAYGFPSVKDMNSELKNPNSNASRIFAKLGVLEIVQTLSSLNGFKDDIGNLLSEAQKAAVAAVSDIQSGAASSIVKGALEAAESVISKSAAAISGGKALDSSNSTGVDAVASNAEAEFILSELTTTDGQTISQTGEVDKIVAQYIKDRAPIQADKETQVALMASSKLDGFLTAAKLKDFKANFSEWTGVSINRGIYGAGTLADTISTNDNKPVFMSSKKSSTPLSVDAYFNELLLDNIREGLSIHYVNTLDMDSPLFIDIYGNILTESGIVVIPFAANGTFHNHYNLMTAAFLLSYGKTASVEVDAKTNLGLIHGFPIDIERASLNSLESYPYLMQNDYGDTEIITKDMTDTYYILNPVLISTEDGSMALSRMSSMDIRTRQLLYNLNYSLYLGKSGSADFNVSDAPIRTNIITSRVIFEVLRGSLLENIDYEKENLNVFLGFDSGSLSRAIQLDNLTKAIDSWSLNTVISIPDPNYVKGIEYAIFMLYKLTLIAYVLFLAFYFYKSGVNQTFGWLTFPKALLAFTLIMLFITQLSSVFSISYYSATKKLLQPEALTILMLNEEKGNNGIELGVLDAEPVTGGSELQLKVKDVKIPWYAMLVDMIALNDIHSMGEIYERRAKSDVELVASEDYILKGNTVYMNVQDLFNSTELYTDYNSNQLINIVNKENPISFRLPYYAFLDYIVYNVNAYNNTIGSYDYTQIRLADGRTRSAGLSERYFNSAVYRIHRNDVLSHRDTIPAGIDESTLQLSLYDKVGIFPIYEQGAWDNRDIFKGSAGLFKNNQWYVDNLPDDAVRDIADRLDIKAINWVKDNSALCGKISDEVFIKSLALYMSLEYNKMNHVPGPKDIEIQSIANSDLMRLLLCDNNSVLTLSTYSFPKLMLEKGGTIGIYLAAILYIIILLLTFVRPLATVAVVVSAIVSLALYKILLSKKSENVKGFCKMLLLIIILNILYSVTLKGLIVLAGLHVNILIMLILTIAFYVVQLLANVWITYMVIRNWQDFTNLALDTVVRERTLDVNVISSRQEAYAAQSYHRSEKAREFYTQLEELDRKRASNRYMDDDL